MLVANDVECGNAIQSIVNASTAHSDLGFQAWYLFKKNAQGRALPKTFLEYRQLHLEAKNLDRSDDWMTFLCTCDELDHWQKSSFLSFIASLNQSADAILLMSHSIIYFFTTKTVIFQRSHEVVEDFLLQLLGMFGQRVTAAPYIVKQALLTAVASILDTPDARNLNQIITAAPLKCALLFYAMDEPIISHCSLNSSIRGERVWYICRDDVVNAVSTLVEENFDCFENVLIDVVYDSCIEGLLELAQKISKDEKLFGVSIALLRQMDVFFEEERVSEYLEEIVENAGSQHHWYPFSLLSN